MKKIIAVAAMLMAFGGLKAQDCDAIMLPFFKGDMQRMEEYKAVAPEKFEYRCMISQSMMDVSDTIPQGALNFNINELTDILTGEKLSVSFVVDLNVMSFYQYSFYDFLTQIPQREEGIICFSTPSSEHPYLLVFSNHYMKGRLKGETE